MDLVSISPGGASNAHFLGTKLDEVQSKRLSCHIILGICTRVIPGNESIISISERVLSPPLIDTLHRISSPRPVQRKYEGDKRGEGEGRERTREHVNTCLSYIGHTG